MTYDDATMLAYFLEEKGDVTRWCDWEKRKPVIEAECPELIAALTQLTVAERTLDAVLKSVKARFDV